MCSPDPTLPSTIKPIYILIKDLVEFNILDYSLMREIITSVFNFEHDERLEIYLALRKEIKRHLIEFKEHVKKMV